MAEGPSREATSVSISRREDEGAEGAGEDYREWCERSADTREAKGEMGCEGRRGRAERTDASDPLFLCSVRSADLRSSRCSLACLSAASLFFLASISRRRASCERGYEARRV